MNAVDTQKASEPTGPKKTTRRRALGSKKVLSILAHGEPFVWLTGGALILCLVMIIGLLLLVFNLGTQTFIPLPIVQLKLHDGRTLMGEVSKDETIPISADTLLRDAPENAAFLINTFVSEVANLADAIPVQINQNKERLSAERVAIKRKLGIVQKELDALEAKADGKLSTISSKRTWAAGSAGSEKLTKVKDAVGTFKSRLEAIDAELLTHDNSAAYFKDAFAKSSDAASVFVNAQYDFKATGLKALIDLVATARGVDQVTVRNRRLRTGNFDLTNEHFDWVSDYQVVEDGETYPEDATLLERMAWGRFYGFPRTMIEVINREPSVEEKNVDDGLAFLQANQHRLSEEQQKQVADNLATAQEKLAELRSDGGKEFLEFAQKDNDADKIEVGDSLGQTHALNQVPEGATIKQAQRVWTDPEVVWKKFEDLHHGVRERHHESTYLQKHELGHEYAKQEKMRLAVRQIEIDHDQPVLETLRELRELRLEKEAIEDQLEKADNAVTRFKNVSGNSNLGEMATYAFEQLKTEQLTRIGQLETELADKRANFNDLPKKAQGIIDRYATTQAEAEMASAEIKSRIDKLDEENQRFKLGMDTASGQTASLALGEIVRAYQANQLDSGEKRSIYFGRWWEFLTDEPREANSEGGVLPAIWGTVTMTMIMSIAVVPFGVLAALYLREYAKAGPIVSAVRIAINNLAGVPSIVFGVFGLGFFCYIIGGYVDGGPKNAGFETFGSATWYAWLAGLAIVSVIAFFASLYGSSGRAAERSMLRRIASVCGFGLWIVAFVVLLVVLFGTPYFEGFYQANLPNPTWGKGGVLWAALTLALMTLPVVIVATEETLSAVPNSMREGSYGCGASKWQTIRRVVLPQALPGIMTGMILAMARGAGEVAPLMLVGAVKLAPELPIDGVAPFIHADRSFMHLGFHIFDLGFQSQNSEAAKPMVYTTTLLLIVIITVLNLLAIWMRAFLRKKFSAGQF